MKSVELLTTIRHGESEYNKHRSNLKESTLYKEFLEGLSIGQSDNDVIQNIAIRLLGLNRDFEKNEDIPLSESGRAQARNTASKLKNLIEVPDVIYLSPYKRTVETLSQMVIGWPELGKVQTFEDKRLVEQEHGQFLKYGDWKLFCFYNPDQHEIRNERGIYYYRYPDGESIEDVQNRTKSLLEEISEKCRGKQVLIVSHNIAILAIMANIEELEPEEIIENIRKGESVNCGVTTYRRGNKQGLVNSKLY